MVAALRPSHAEQAARDSYTPHQERFRTENTVKIGKATACRYPKGALHKNAYVSRSYTTKTQTGP